MQNTLGTKPQKLFIGDVHGKIDQYWKILQKHPDMPSIQVGDCVTANVSINYLSPLNKDENYGLFTYIQFESNNKVGISVRLETDDERIIAYASFLFIKRK